MSKNSVSVQDVEPETEAVQKMGLGRYLQIMPQDRGITAVLRSKYAMDVKTKDDWDTTLEAILNRKAK